MASEFETTFASAVHGHNMYKDIWNPVVVEILQCEHKEENEHDRFAIACKKANGTIVGHVLYCIVLYNLILWRKCPIQSIDWFSRGSSLIHVIKAKINTNTHNNKDRIKTGQGQRIKQKKSY